MTKKVLISKSFKEVIIWSEGGKKEREKGKKERKDILKE